MYTISEDDLMAAKKKLEEVNGGKTPTPDSQLAMLMHSVSEMSVTHNMALGAMLLSVIGKGEPDKAVASAIATGIVLGFQAGLTRAVDDPVKTLVESVGTSTANA